MSIMDGLCRRGRARVAGEGSRGAVEIGVVAVVGALLAGGLAEVGLTDTVVSLSDGLTWLGDDENGEVVQVNPATGDPQVRLDVAGAGEQLVVTQGDGVLVVTNLATGEVTVINTATLGVGGSRAGTAGGVEVLYDQSRLYVVDLVAGVVQRIDPTTAADIGTPWVAGAALFDAAIDGQGLVRVLRGDGRLFTLGWTPGGVREAAPARPIRGAGAGSVLVPHPRGVTVFASETDTAVRVDTGRDRSLPAAGLTPPLYPAPTAPVELVPVSMAEAGTVLVVYGDRLVPVDTSGLGCRRPGQPVVFRNLVHVPCLGAGKVVVLTRDGRDRPADIAVGGRGDPKLVLDDGRLIVHAPGAGVVVEPDGRTRPIRTGAGVPVRDPANPPPPPAPRPVPPPPPPPGGINRPAPPPPPVAGQPEPGDPLAPIAPPGGSPAPVAPGPGAPGTPNPGVPVVPSAPPPASPTPGPPAQPPKPTGVSAQAGTGGVQVSWQTTMDPDSFRILRADTLDSLATVAGSARSAIFNTIPAGTSVRLIVEADYDGATVRSDPSDPVTPFAAPGQPTGVTAVATVSGGALQITVDWQLGSTNGSPLTGHTVRVTTNRGHDLTNQAGGNQTSTVFTTQCDELPVADPPCGGITINADVRAANAAGTSPAGTAARTYDPPTTPPQVTRLACVYSANDPEAGPATLCTMQYSGIATTIRWNLSPWDGGSADNQTSGLFPCGGVIRVTVANAAGSDFDERPTRCQGPIP